MKEIILASASPRRKEILAATGLKFTVRTSGYEENLETSMDPRSLARYLSRKKAEAVSPCTNDAVIIAADTFIVCNRKILGKPRSRSDAANMLGVLSGRAHSVITGYTIRDSATSRCLSRSVVTKVFFRKIDVSEIRAYIQSGEPLDKAGAYAIQGLGALFIEKIEGDYLNVVGLPLFSLMQSLRKFGIHVLNEQRV